MTRQTSKKLQGWENMENIGKDAQEAKATGISYGKFKAGVLKEEKNSDYAISSTEFVRRSEGTCGDKKPVAFIR